MLKKLFYIFTVLVFASCASLRQANLQAPIEVESKNKILEIPQEKQPEIKEITVVVPEPVVASVAVQKKIIKKSKQKAELKKVVSPFLVGETFKIDLKKF